MSIICYFALKQLNRDSIVHFGSPKLGPFRIKHDPVVLTYGRRPWPM